MTRLTSIRFTAGLIGAVALAGLAIAQQHPAGHGAAATSTPGSAATAAYKAANMKMHKDLDVAFSGDADADFVRGMIPHHQGAIDMAKILLAYGKDPEIKKLATGVITEQEKEIALMRDWLKKNGK